MAKVIVVCGAIVVKDNKFVLVKEAKKTCYGKWNYPAGHLDAGEDIFAAAIREVKEETNLDVKLDGLIGIYENTKGEIGDNVVKFVFKASVTSGTLKHAKDELLDAKWFTFEEFEKLKEDEIRGQYVQKALNDYKNNKMFDLNVIKTNYS